MTVLRFESDIFDIKSEPKNEFNPIFGYAVGEWLRKKCKANGLDVTSEVENEDWGWYFYVEKNDQSYMIGTCSYADVCEDTGHALLNNEPIEHLVQFEKHRSFKEKLLGKNKMEEDDPIVKMVETVITTEIRDVKYLGRE